MNSLLYHQLVLLFYWYFIFICLSCGDMVLDLLKNIFCKKKLIKKVFNISLLIFFAFGCAHKQEEINNVLKKSGKIIKELNAKIISGTLTFEDIFYSKYGKYDEKTEETEEELDYLIEQIEKYKQGVEKDGKIIKLDIVDILEKNKDKIADIMCNKDNLNYNIYGTNKEQWFKNEPRLRAPLNYFQQQVLLHSKKETLRDISILVVKKILVSKKECEINFGILWCVYGAGNNLDEAFVLIDDFAKKCLKKVNNGGFLTQQEEKVLREMVGFNVIYEAKTDGFFEKVSMNLVGKKVKGIMENTDKALKRNELNKQKIKK